ncbi:MAG: hypothetical protein ACE5EX_07185 [Phycisphaerae bacterium]
MNACDSDGRSRDHACFHPAPLHGREGLVDRPPRRGATPGRVIGRFGFALRVVAACLPVVLVVAVQADGQDRKFLPQTKGKLPGFHAYTQGHAKEQNPPDRLGGPLTVTVTQTNGSTRLVLPGPRFLDPSVFGTPEHPTGFDPAPFPLMGVPLDMRRAVDGKYTFVNHPTPFSDWREVGVGSVRQVTVDATAIDGARTKDKIQFEATFKLPGPDPDNPDAGATRYRVTCTTPLPHGFGFPTFGGVATNHLLHGVTGLGTRLMPTEWTYVDIWGKGDIYKNDKLISKDHMIHTMVTEIVRGEGYKLRFDGEVGPPAQGITMHLMIPPYKPTPNGMVKDPIKTMFVPFPYIERHMMADIEATKKLPPAERKERMARIAEIKELMNWTREQIVKETIAGNMAGMPFIHIMFGNIKMEAGH